MNISSASWKKQQPPGLTKSGSAMEKALAEVEKASKAFEGKSDAVAKALEAALDTLEKAAKAVASEAKDLEKKEKDKKAKKALADVQSDVGKSLSKEIAALRAKIAAVAKDAAKGDEEDDKKDVFSTPEAHAAYFKKWSTKLKRGKVNFAVGLPSNKPEEIRFNFHPKKGGRGLAGVLKKKAGARKFTFGTAGTDALAAELGVDDLAARTLVLDIDGKKIPALAKRVRLLFRALGVAQFSKVKVFLGGQEIDGSDEDDTDDLDLEAMDFETEDADDIIGDDEGQDDEVYVEDGEDEDAGDDVLEAQPVTAGPDGAGGEAAPDPEAEARKARRRGDLDALESDVDELMKLLA